MASIIALIFAVILYIIIQVFKSPSSTGNYDDGYYSHHSNTNDRYDDDDRDDNDNRCDNDSDSSSSDDSSCDSSSSSDD